MTWRRTCRPPCKGPLKKKRGSSCSTTDKYIVTTPSTITSSRTSLSSSSRGHSLCRSHRQYSSQGIWYRKVFSSQSSATWKLPPSTACCTTSTEDPAKAVTVPDSPAETTGIRKCVHAKECIFTNDAYEECTSSCLSAQHSKWYQINLG